MARILALLGLVLIALAAVVILMWPSQEGSAAASTPAEQKPQEAAEDAEGSPAEQARAETGSAPVDADAAADGTGTGAIAGGAGGAAWYLFAEQRILFDVGYLIVALLLLYTMLTFSGYATEEANRRRVRQAFGFYLAPAMVEKLAEDPSQLRLGGERRTMSMLFCDVRGFTGISETFRDDPAGLTHLINTLLTPLTAVIMDRRGTVDKYMGDCIMAFWNAPLDDPDHARNACLAALDMQAAMDPLNERLAAEAAEAGREYKPLAIGVGVNTGDVVVGNMGSDQRFDYSVLGDDVNLASRLEGQSVDECRAFVDGMGLAGVYDVFAARIAHYQQEPPGADWDGVFDATTK